MIKQLLTNGFKMNRVGDGTAYCASVPGSVYQVYLEHGQMGDPYWRDNEMQAQTIAEYDYEYSLSFEADRMLFEQDEIILRMEGIDTLSDIYLNGIHLGNTDNMHRIWEFSVKKLLHQGQHNHLKVVLHSPVRYIKKVYEQCECDGAPECSTGFAHLRKAHCMFGWDWGPRLPDMGIWRSVMLLGMKQARILGVFVTQIHTAELSHPDFNLCGSTQTKAMTELKIEAEIQQFTEKAKDLYYEVILTSPDGKSKRYQDSPEKIVIQEPMLWWPNGYGEQYLYRIELILMRDNSILDRWDQHIGLRTMTVNTSKDEYGEMFAHEVNGIRIFAMGADYIPEDCILGRRTKERTRKLLMQCKESNFNVIRVWGGGGYPEDYFYDICDELGLIVWQDFMFACAVYDLNDSFEENIKLELRDNIKRIRHHACLGLWCGNNEMELFISHNQWIKRQKQKTDYLTINEYIIPKLVKQYDPNTFYWTSSPSSGGSFDAPNDETRGDVHYWEVWHGGVPFTDFRKYHFRYLSEFGFQSFPSMKTIESFTEEEDRNVFSYVIEKHQRNDAANGKILHYLSQTFLYPSSFELLVYASQLLQAEAIKYGVEHFRRNRGRCMGTVYWQLNDCWPGASWSSIDYYGRLKALHYFAKRFFAPILLSCEEEGSLTQNTNVNAEFQEIEKSASFCISNETLAVQKLMVKWTLRDSYSNVLQQGSYETTVEPLSTKWHPKLQFSNARLKQDYLSYELWQGEMISEGMLLFGVPKHYEFADPKLRLCIVDGEILITSEAFAKGVEIGNADGTLQLSENFFDMNAGVKRIQVRDGSLDSIWARSVYDIR